jgi:hypothetical protein
VRAGKLYGQPFAVDVASGDPIRTARAAKAGTEHAFTRSW